MRKQSSLIVLLGVVLGTAACSSASTTSSPSPSPSSTAPGTVIVPDGGTSSVIPVGGDAGTTTTGGTCDIQTGSATCDACFKQSCCAQVAACGADADCVALDACLEKCPDPQTQQGQQCGDTCYQQHPQGGAKADAIDACGAQKCQAACK